MPAENATVTVYDDPAEAGRALRELRAAGFRAEEISVAARYREPEGDPGRTAGFWNAVRQALPEWRVEQVPGTERVRVAGRLAEWVAVSLENAAIFTGLSPLGAALYSIGVPRWAIACYDAALREGKCLIVAHGPAGEVARAKRLLNGIGEQQGAGFSG